jgi:hypothetical protein
MKMKINQMVYILNQMVYILSMTLYTIWLFNIAIENHHF